MKALAENEIENLVQTLQVYVGAKAQELIVTDQICGLGVFQNPGGLSWLWFQNHTWWPVLLPLKNPPFYKNTSVKPLLLFLRAHLLGLTIKSITRDQQLGRAVVVNFGHHEKMVELSFHLWPHGGNVIAKTDSNIMRLQKMSAPKEQTTLLNAERPEPRSLEQILREWSESLENIPKAKNEKKVEVQDIRAKQIKKLERTIAKVEAEVANKKQVPWRKIGEALQAQQNLEVPAEWEVFIDKRRKLSWNIENSFSQAKENEKKLAATELRLQILHEELQKWQQSEVVPIEVEGKIPKAATKKNKEALSKFRSYPIADGVRLLIGRNAQENLAILRAARAWDFWCHLRDYPGSHGIISREKNQSIGGAVIHQAAQMLLKQTFGQKVAQHQDELFDMVVTQCRFVKPIRGDRLGRVNYSNESIHRVRCAIS